MDREVRGYDPADRIINILDAEKNENEIMMIHGLSLGYRPSEMLSIRAEKFDSLMIEPFKVQRGMFDFLRITFDMAKKTCEIEVQNDGNARCL